MRVLRNIQRSVRGWFQDLIHTPAWSGKPSRLGSWFSRLIMVMAQARTPFTGGVNPSIWAGFQKAIARPLQVGVLFLMAASSILILASIWIAPGWGAYQPAPVTYPEPTEVGGWQAAGWEPLEIQSRERPRALSGARYTYRAGATLLEAEVRYLVRATGDVASYWRHRTGLDLDGQLRALPGGGWYRVHANEETIWLDASVDASGHSVATPRQFDANRRLYDRSLQRLGLWLVARRPLEDRRCLWVHLSIPADSVSGEEEASRLLESFWVQWHGAWRGRLRSTTATDEGPAVTGRASIGPTGTSTTDGSADVEEPHEQLAGRVRG